MKQNCPLCNENISNIIFSKLISDTYKIDISKCENCGFIYSDSEIDESELK